MSQDDEHRARGAKAAALAKTVAHRSSGGHSPHIAQLRNRVEHDPNTVPHPHRAHRMTYEYQAYPKWLHFDGAPSVLVQDETEQDAVLAARPEVSDKPRNKGGRPRKAEAAEGETEQLDPGAGQGDAT